ncbi:MAG: Asp23/Gls24 family envelope stress response protein [Oscillospiraceae bacterium]|nr:Asp23/Gls24 family envelope stress response protein [Oscillospiraceae bacterium]
MIATGKIAGISLPSAGVGDGIAGLLGMKGATRGVRIEADEKSVAVDITVIVDYGIRINEVAKTLQDEVRNDLDTMTGLFVSHVNVHVTSVNTTSAKEPLAGKSQRASRTPREAPLKEAPLKEAPPKDASPINAPPKDAPPKDASPKDAAPEDVPRDESAAQQADKTHVQQAE